MELATCVNYCPHHIKHVLRVSAQHGHVGYIQDPIHCITSLPIYTTAPRTAPRNPWLTCNGRGSGLWRPCSGQTLRASGRRRPARKTAPRPRPPSTAYSEGFPQTVSQSRRSVAEFDQHQEQEQACPYTVETGYKVTAYRVNSAKK